MKRYLLVSSLVVLVGLLVSADAFARGRGRCGCKGLRGAGFGPGVTANLDLTEHQQQKLTELRTEHAESVATAQALSAATLRRE